jgi:hypothetical protein
MRPIRFDARAISFLLVAGLSASVGAQQPSEKSAAKPGMTGPSEKSSTQPVKPGVTVPRASQLQGFSVVLLLGDMQPGESQDTVPVAARRALNDMKDFLPYKGYRLLDTQWVLCCSGSAPAFTRLRGVEEQEYELEVRGSQDLAGNIHVRFVMREPNLAQVSQVFKADSERTSMHPKEMAKGADGEDLSKERELFQLERERVDLTTQLSSLRGKVEVGMANPDEVRRMDAQLVMVSRRINDLKQSQAAAPSKTSLGRAVIDTSFRMEEGETVVVGSSGVKGGKRALIALLTAAAPSRKKTDSR